MSSVNNTSYPSQDNSMNYQDQQQQYSPELPQLRRKNSASSINTGRSIITTASTASTAIAPRNVATDSLFAQDDRFRRKSRSTTRLQTLKNMRSDSMTSLSSYNNITNGEIRNATTTTGYRPHMPNSISTSNISNLPEHQLGNGFHSNASSRRPSMTSTSQLYHSSSSTSMNQQYHQNLMNINNTHSNNSAYPRSPKTNIPRTSSSKSMNQANGTYLFPNGEIFRPRQTPKNRSARPQKISRQYQQIPPSALPVPVAQSSSSSSQQGQYPKQHQGNNMSSYSSMPNLKSFTRQSTGLDTNGQLQNGGYLSQGFRSNPYPAVNQNPYGNDINTLNIAPNPQNLTTFQDLPNALSMNEFDMDDMNTNNSGSISSRTGTSTAQSSTSRGGHIYSDSLPSNSNNSSNSSNPSPVYELGSTSANDKLLPPLNSISNQNNNRVSNSDHSIVTPSNSSTSSSLALNNQNSLQSPLTILSSYENLNSSGDDELDNTQCNLKANLSMIKETSTIPDLSPTTQTTVSLNAPSGNGFSYHENSQFDHVDQIDIVQPKQSLAVEQVAMESNVPQLEDDRSSIVRHIPVEHRQSVPNIFTQETKQQPQIETRRVQPNPIRHSIATSKPKQYEEISRKPSMMKKIFGKLFSRSTPSDSVKRTQSNRPSTVASTATAPFGKEKKSLYQLPKEKSASTWSIAAKFKKQPARTSHSPNKHSNVEKSSNLSRQVVHGNVHSDSNDMHNRNAGIKGGNSTVDPSQTLEHSSPIGKTDTYNYDFDDLNSFEIGDDTFLQEGTDLLAEAAANIPEDSNVKEKESELIAETDALSPILSAVDEHQALTTVVEDEVSDFEDVSKSLSSHDISNSSNGLDSDTNGDITADESLLGFDEDLDYISTIIGLGETSLFFDHKQQNEKSALQRRKSIRIKSLEKRKSLIRHNTIGSNRSNNSTLFGEDGTSSTIKSFDTNNSLDDGYDDEMEYLYDFKSLQKTHMNGVDSTQLDESNLFEVLTTNSRKIPLSRLDLSLMPKRKSCLKERTAASSTAGRSSGKSSGASSPDSSSSSLNKQNNASSFVQVNNARADSSTSLNSTLSFTASSPLNPASSANKSPSPPPSSSFQDSGYQFTTLDELSRTPSMKKSVAFSNKVTLNDTFSATDYDRYNLPLKQTYQFLSTNPSKIKEIRIELNNFKQRDMPIHEMSKIYTHFLHT